ncbi:MAG: AAA family ATPase [Phycisphaeraceae bacterium]|nr:AAA family ATPase [Phycisphaeraceae bacterium]
MPDIVTGTVERTYYSDAAFSAGMLRTDDGAKVRFRGKFYAAAGDRLSAIGTWTIDPKYGHQFEVRQLDYELPQTREGIVNYLAKHPAFEGIGEKTAEKIVGVLRDGESLDEALRDRSDDLRRAGVPQRVIDTLAQAWTEHASENAVRSYLAGFGLTHHQMETLLERFGTSIVSMLKHDPYLLIQHLFGFGFKRVDQIALKMGIAKTHPGRIEAAISHCLGEQVNGGHTWTPGAELVDQANAVLIIDSLDSRSMIEAAGTRLLERGDLVADGNAVTTPRIRDDERSIRDALARYAWLEPGRPIAAAPDADLGNDQREAYRTALASRISVISGGAGTGKTFVVARIAKACRESGGSGRTLSLCAPTGKAAKRIEQLLGQQGIDAGASTIHRLLGYNGHEFREGILAADVVVVDEVSMVDVRLMAELLRHIDLERTQLILVGDHHQLPPVGPGNVLRDIIEHGLAPTAVMTKVHRHAGVLKTSSVGVLDGAIARSAEDSQSRWLVVDAFSEAPAIKSHLRDLILDEIPRHLGFDALADVQIITPEHRGHLGTRSINQMMQFLHFGSVEGRFAVGDKVIQTRNDYDLGVMNGTVGFVRAIDKGGVTIAFDGCAAETHELDWPKAQHVELAYALTAHKAQGSEFPCAVVLCHKSHFFADRNWLYTAVTRASHTCILVGDDYGLRRAARHVRNMKRRTLLSLWAGREREEAAA